MDSTVVSKPTRYDWWDKITQRAGFLVCLYSFGYWKFSPMWILMATSVAVYHSWRQQKALSATASVLFERKMQEQQHLTQLMTNSRSWLTFAESERAAWLNRTLSAVWIHAKKATEDSISASLSGIFTNMKPKFLTKLGFSTLDMGPLPPTITGVRVVRDSQLDDSAVVLDMDLLMNTKTNIQLEASTGPVGLYVTVADLVLQARMRVILRPLSDNWPCFSALSITFTHKPLIEFKLQAAKVPLSSIPGFQSWLETFLRDTLSYYLVNPKRIVVPLIDMEKMPGVLDELYDEKAEGILTVKLNQGSKLVNLDTFGASDPFCELTLGDDSRQSETLNNTLAPVWKDAVFSWIVFDSKSEVLRIKCLDEENIGAPRPMGDCEVPLSTLEPNASIQKWVALRHVTSGSLELIFTWQPFVDIGERHRRRSSIAAAAEDIATGRKRTASVAEPGASPYDKGGLFVLVHRCVNLPRMNKGKDNSCDPYVVCTVGKESQKTFVVPKKSDPVYNQRFKYLTERVSDLKVEVFDYEKMGAPRPVGSVAITPELMKTKRLYQLKDRTGRPTEAQIELTVEFRAVGKFPASVLRRDSAGKSLAVMASESGTLTISIESIIPRNETATKDLVDSVRLVVMDMKGGMRGKEKIVKRDKWDDISVPAQSDDRAVITLYKKKAKEENSQISYLIGTLYDEPEKNKEYPLENFAVRISAYWKPEAKKDR